MCKRLALILLSCVLCVAATALQPALTVGNATEVTGQTITGFIAAAGDLMEPEPGKSREVEGVLNPAAVRGRDGELLSLPATETEVLRTRLAELQP